jgi:5-methyltetrahydrofolate--homocysteine methyltransferase
MAQTQWKKLEGYIVIYNMEDLLKRINKGDLLLADGAMGTMIFEKGLDPGDCPESINLKNPYILKEIAEAYLEAGAEILQTNTFGGSSIKLSFCSLEDKTEDVNRNAVRFAKAVAGDKAYVSGSCGPTGKLLKPYGDVSSEEVFLSFRAQMKILIEEGVDIICVETMTDLTEAALAVLAARSISETIPILATMTFDKTPKGFYTMMGIGVQEAAEGLEDAGADIIGSNCGNGIENMVKIAREFNRHTELPIIIQSNAGIPDLKDDKPVYSESPEFMAGKVKELVDAEVSIIGGCCGTTPQHIRAFRKVIDSIKKK